MVRRVVESTQLICAHEQGHREDIFVYYHTRSSDCIAHVKTLLIGGGLPCVPRGDSVVGGERVEWGGQCTGRVANGYALP